MGNAEYMGTFVPYASAHESQHEAEISK